MAYVTKRHAFIKKTSGSFVSGFKKISKDHNLWAYSPSYQIWIAGFLEHSTTLLYLLKTQKEHHKIECFFLIQEANDERKQFKKL